MYTPLRRIANLLTKPLARACVARPSMQAWCQAVDRWIDDNGVKQVAELPRCVDAPGVTPCWSLADDDGCRATEQLFTVERGGAALPAGLMSAITATALANRHRFDGAVVQSDQLRPAGPANRSPSPRAAGRG